MYKNAGFVRLQQAVYFRYYPLSSTWKPPSLRPMATPANNFISHCQSNICLHIFTFSKNLLAEIRPVREVTSCRLVDSYHCFIYTEDEDIASHRHVTKSIQCTKQNGVTSQKPVILTLTAITAQNMSSFLFSRRNSPSGSGPPQYRGYTITPTYIPPGRTPLDK